MDAAEVSSAAGGISLLYSLAEDSPVQATIHDVQGRKVACLYSGWMAAGTHTLHWDGARSPASVYYYNIQTGQRRLEGRIILAR